MPLTELQFELATTDDPVEILSRIQKFLAEHSGLAYSSSEVAQALGLDPDTALSALYQLALAQGIEGRTFSDGLYFRHIRLVPIEDVLAA